MAKAFLVLLLLAVVGCDQAPPSADDAGAWTLVDKTPSGYGIYKKRCPGEGVTFYATKSHHPDFWTITAVRDKVE